MTTTVDLKKKAYQLPNFLVPGDTFGDHYRIECLVDKGTFGQVYRAYDLERATWVALKIAHAASLEDEGKLLAILAPNTHVPQVFESGWAEGYWYLAMEYIAGTTLRQVLDAYLQANRRMPMEEILHIAQGLCSIFMVLHERKYPIVFCDLKPENILITPAQEVYLVDFGIARHDPRWSPPRNGDTIDGTLPYIAPEYLNKHYVTPRADIYALGVVLFEMLTGDIPQVCRCFRKPCPHGGYRFKRLQGPLGDLVMQMVHPFDKRPAHVRDLKQAFEQILEQSSLEQSEEPVKWQGNHPSLLRQVGDALARRLFF